MKKLPVFSFMALLAFIFLVSCEKDDNPGGGDSNYPSGITIASFQVATQEALRSIPVEYINAARNNLHIAYQHTSHGTHVSYGMFGLQDFKNGDDVKFAITCNDPQANKLDFRDYAMENYAETGIDASDLSRNETAFIQATRNYLDDAANASINVVMWSWCSIRDHDVAGNYLPGMQQLISEYGAGGSKIGSGAGKRANTVTFVFMTGHAESDDNIGYRRPKNQADTIISFCKAHNYFCLDYYGIDTHDMEGNYWSDAADNGSSTAYGGNYYVDWQEDNIEGEGYYYNKSSPGGAIDTGTHVEQQHITSNRKAFAMWYILAMIVGWDGTSE
jgi:hypothetical protein